MIVELRDRHLTDELMDDPELDPQVHESALNGLRRINSVTMANRLICKAVLQLHSESSRPISVLDVACGSGDLLCAIGAAAARRGKTVRLCGVDISPKAVDIARQRSRSCQQEIKFQIGNALNMPAAPSYDVVCCSLFLHHLSSEKALDLLHSMKELADRTVLVADLRRTWPGYLYAAIGTRLLTTSRIVHVDGVKSVRAAFSLEEIRELADSAQMHGAELVTYWPQRFLLRWSKRKEDTCAR